MSSEVTVVGGAGVYGGGVGREVGVVVCVFEGDGDHRDRHVLTRSFPTRRSSDRLSIATFTRVIFMQQVGGYKALEAGLAIMPVTLAMFFLSPRFGKIGRAHV